MKNKQIEGSRYIRDESDRQGMRIAHGIEKGTSCPGFSSISFTNITQMETSFGIIFLAVVNNRPRTVPFKEMLSNLSLHRKEIIIRRTRYDLKRAEERAHHSRRAENCAGQPG